MWGRRRQWWKFQPLKLWIVLRSLPAVTWLKYCRFGVKLYPINQSINQSISSSDVICKWSFSLLKTLYPILQVDVHCHGKAWKDFDGVYFCFKFPALECFARSCEYVIMHCWFWTTDHMNTSSLLMNDCKI